MAMDGSERVGGTERRAISDADTVYFVDMTEALAYDDRQPLERPGDP
jgi:hypothetical protein